MLHSTCLCHCMVHQLTFFSQFLLFDWGTDDTNILPNPLRCTAPLPFPAHSRFLDIQLQKGRGGGRRQGSLAFGPPKGAQLIRSF